MAMISVEQALEKILSYVDVLEDEEGSILDCLGQVLAEDVYSTVTIPPLDNSAMDGYAVQSRDTRGASKESPRFLRVIDTVPAGSISKCEIESGTAIRIMTGAPVPKGADSVIQFEDTDEVSRPKGFDEIGILKEIETNIDAGKENQYQTFDVYFELDYDNAGLIGTLEVHDDIVFRIRRIAVAGTEVANEILILDVYVEFLCNKLGEAS